MKTTTIVTGFAACLIAVAFTACDKKTGTDSSIAPATNAVAATTMDAVKDTATKTVDAAKDMTAKAVDSAKDMSAQAVDSTKQAAAKAADMATSAATNATAAVTAMVKGISAPAVPAMPASPTDSATAKFTEVVATAKQDLADKNYQGTLDEIKKLADVQLSAEQQKIVDDLKAEAQKQLAAAAGGGMNAVQGMMGK